MEILESTTDAKGRKLEVIKVPCPPPMFRTHHEADTVDVSGGLVLRCLDRGACMLMVVCQACWWLDAWAAVLGASACSVACAVHLYSMVCMLSSCC